MQSLFLRPAHQLLLSLEEKSASSSKSMSHNAGGGGNMGEWDGRGEEWKRLG